MKSWPRPGLHRGFSGRGPNDIGQFLFQLFQPQNPFVDFDRHTAPVGLHLELGEIVSFPGQGRFDPAPQGHFAHRRQGALGGSERLGPDALHNKFYRSLKGFFVNGRTEVVVLGLPRPRSLEVFHPAPGGSVHGPDYFQGLFPVKALFPGPLQTVLFFGDETDLEHMGHVLGDEVGAQAPVDQPVLFPQQPGHGLAQIG